VIGQGFNDYRPGYNGGVLKTGRLSSASDGPAIAELKQKLKNKSKPGPLKTEDERSEVSFIPFESFGGGQFSNAPLSMHSEMMAVLSALNVSRTLSSTVLSTEKPVSKSSSKSKRKERLQAYVNSICEAAPSSGQVHVRECGFEAGAYQSGVFVEQQDQQWEYEREEERCEREEEESVWAAASG